MEEKKMNTGIHIGHNIGDLELAFSQIMQILNSKNDQKTIRVALEVFGKSLKIEEVKVQGCNFGFTDKGVHLGNKSQNLSEEE